MTGPYAWVWVVGIVAGIAYLHAKSKNRSNPGERAGNAGILTLGILVMIGVALFYVELGARCYDSATTGKRHYWPGGERYVNEP